MSGTPFTFPPPPPPPPKRPAESQLPPAGGYQGHRGSHRGSFSNRGPHSGFHGRGRGGSGFPGTSQRSHHGPRGGHTQSGPNRPPSGHAHGLNPPQKRVHAAAFHPNSTLLARSRPPAAPSVPSFNASIEGLLKTSNSAPFSPPAQTLQSPARPRKTNILGLTPSQDDSEPEDDEGEEQRLGQGGLDTLALQFEHKGRTLALKTPADIKAWIAERRKNFPTEAKREAARKEAEERKRQWQEEKKLRLEKQQEEKRAREQRRREERERRKQKDDGAKQPAGGAGGADGATATATDSMKAAVAKAEKMRKKAERAERQLRAAEEALRAAQAATDTPTATGVAAGVAPPEMAAAQADHVDAAIQKVEAAALMSNTATPASAEPQPDAMDDETSSSGATDSDIDDSSSSDSVDGEDSDSDSDAPLEERSTQQPHPPAVLTPPPNGQRPAASKPLRPCSMFMRNGRCKFGSSCRFSHDRAARDVHAPDGTRTARGKRAAATPQPVRRKGLWQVMVDKEIEDERKRLLNVIVALGEKGALDEPSESAKS